MNYISILFSKNHFLEPLTIVQDQEIISIKDKKIKLIALSILASIILPVVGGIIVFYCLAAMYKIKQLHLSEIRKASTPENLNVINALVSRFLHPYITGEITKETDSPREPLIQLLKKQLAEVKLTIDTFALETLAIDAFIQQSALGLYPHRYLQLQPSERRSTINDDITPSSPLFKELVEALKYAIPREFPGKKLSSSTIHLKATEALKMVNDRRAQDQVRFRESRNNTDFKSEECKDKKFASLKTTGQLFLV